MRTSPIDRMVYWFRMKGGRATLGEILQSGESWAYEFRARMTEARKKGIQFNCQSNVPKSANLYTLVSYDRKGQGGLF